MNGFTHISTELLTKFNDLIYYDVPHKYYLGDQQLTSVTTLIHKYEEAFDEEYWANKKAIDYGISPEEVKRGWRFINKKGTMKGSIIHDYGENLLLKKVFDYPKQEILNEFGFDPIRQEYEITKKHVDNFVRDIKGKLIPVNTELVMYDKESLIAGMFDILFYNVKAKELQIWDWKTNKAFTHVNPGRRLLDDLFTLEASDLEKYSLQLELYKYIIEKNTNIKLGKSYIVWVSHNNDNYKVFETKNRRIYIERIVKNRIHSLAA